MVEDSTRWLRALGLILTFALGILMAPLTAEAQEATHVYRIGLLNSAPTARVEAFRQSLREIGYVEGQNLVIESRYAEGRAVPRPRGGVGPAHGGRHGGRRTSGSRGPARDAHDPDCDGGRQ